MSRSTSRARRPFTAEEKATILRRHLADKVPVSALCEEYRIQPSLFYQWQRQVFDHLGTALQDGRTRRHAAQLARRDDDRVARLEAQVIKKDAVIAAVSEEYLALKKKLGES